MSTIRQIPTSMNFFARYPITLDAAEVESNPLWADRPLPPGLRHYTCLLECGENSMHVFFTNDQGAPPTLEILMDVLAEEMRILGEMQGKPYNVRDLPILKALIEQRSNLVGLLGEDGLRELLALHGCSDIVVRPG